MYCEILSDKVIDISMFIKEKCVSENCNYIYIVWILILMNIVHVG